MSDKSLTDRHMPHVDALRALAVISVFIYHLAPAALPGGFTGVDIFFVISGFVVSASVIQKKPANFPEFFYWILRAAVAPRHASVAGHAACGGFAVCFAYSRCLVERKASDDGVLCVFWIEQFGSFQYVRQLFFTHGRVQSVHAYLVFGSGGAVLPCFSISILIFGTLSKKKMDFCSSISGGLNSIFVDSCVMDGH